MAKLILTSLCAAAALGLAACGGGETNNMAVENLEDLNATVDTSMDMNMDMNMDVNATDNAADNAMDNAADNTATNNSY